MGSGAEESESVYLEFDDALALYAAIIGGTTQQAADQLRDQAGLESALGRPGNYARYQEADLALQAAALAHGIAESQTFIDGNKRRRTRRANPSTASDEPITDSRGAERLG